MANPAERSLLRHPMAKWGLFMGLLFVVWFGGWFAFARFADGKVADALRAANDRGLEIGCANRSMKGFPFRIGVHCDSLDVLNRNDSAQIQTGAVRTAAQLYAPGKMVVELDGPLALKTPSGVADVNWSLMRVFADARLDGGFDIVSLNFADLVVGVSRGTLSAASGALHARPTPATGPATETDKAVDRSLDVAIDLTGLSWTSGGSEFPAVKIEALATLTDGYADLVAARKPLKAVLADGAELIIDKLQVSASGSNSTLAVSGPLEIGTDGLISGQVSIGIDNAQALADEMRQIDPVLGNAIGGLGSAIAGMGQPAKFGDQELRSITVTISQGVAKLGFIQLGKIPPLVLN